MKKIVSYFSASAVIASLFGCSDPNQDINQLLSNSENQNQIRQDTLSTMNKDSHEAHKALEKIREDNPEFKDAYYSINEKGEKVLNVVKEDSSGNALLYGLTGFMIANALNSGIISKSAKVTGVPSNKYDIKKKDDRANYSTALKSSVTSSLLQRKGISASRSSNASKAFSSRTSSTRSGAYSRGA